MKNSYAHILITLLATAALAACGGGGATSSQVLPLRAAHARPQTSILSNIVGVGDSLTAGYQSNGFLGAVGVHNPKRLFRSTRPGERLVGGSLRAGVGRTARYGDFQNVRSVDQSVASDCKARAQQSDHTGLPRSSQFRSRSPATSARTITVSMRRVTTSRGLTGTNGSRLDRNSRRRHSWSDTPRGQRTPRAADRHL